MAPESELQALREQVVELLERLETMQAQLDARADARVATDTPNGLIRQARVAWAIAERAQTWKRGTPASETLRAFLKRLIDRYKINCGQRSGRATVNQILAAVEPPKAGPSPTPLLLAKRALGALLNKEIDPGYAGVRGPWKRLLLDTRPPTMTKTASSAS